MRQKRNNKGFTLVEALMASVILAFAAGAILLPFTSGAASREYGERKALAVNLAQNMVEEILAEDYANVIANYDGYTESKGQITDVSGNLMTDPQYGNFSRTVSCEEIYLDQQSGNSEKSVIRINVKVLYNSETLADINALKCK